jgi:CDP-6-deoxy-D-xylo-4-hexulose-3-dehydrase
MIWPLISPNVWTDEERNAVKAVVDSNHVTIGPQTAAFEKEFEAYHDTMHMAVAVNSGSSANLLAASVIAQADSRRGTWIVPAVGWATTYAPLYQLGYKMHVVDIDATLNMDTQQVAHALATIPDVCGIMVVNVLGTPADLPALRKLADEYKIWFLEDNCESLGAAVGGAYAGTWGDLSTFSFFWSHHITTGEGGMVLARNPYLYGLARSMRSHGWTRGVANMVGGTPDPRYAPFDFVVPGYNFRMMDTQAAPGRVQLRKLDEQVTFRFNNLKALRNNIKGTSLEPASLRGSVSPMAAPFLYTGSNFEKFNRRLHEAGIESRPLIAGNILRQRVAKQYGMTSFPTPRADLWHDRGFYLGIYGEPMEQYVFDELRKIACE